MFTRGLNDLLTKNNYKHIKTASLHPGSVDTNFGGDSKMLKCIKALAVVSSSTNKQVQGLLCIYVISHLTRYEVDNIMIQTQDGSKWIVGEEMHKMLQNYG